MSESYNVAVRTPVGRFTGSIELEREGDSVTGSFDVMGFSSSFRGVADGSSLRFSGSLMTPVGPMDFDVEAVADGHSFTGKATTKAGVFEISDLVRRRKKASG